LKHSNQTIRRNTMSQHVRFVNFKRGYIDMRGTRQLPFKTPISSSHKSHGNRTHRISHSPKRQKPLSVFHPTCTCKAFSPQSSITSPPRPPSMSIPQVQEREENGFAFQASITTQRKNTQTHTYTHVKWDTGLKVRYRACYCSYIPRHQPGHDI
jgi:hypothetical protein